MGSDSKALHANYDRVLFQFTLPHGERLGTLAKSFPSCPFQFTLPHGERPNDDAAHINWFIVSIHAPAWGATFPAWLNSSLLGFQFTLPHGERRLAASRESCLLRFQFTLPHGERRLSTLGVDFLVRFNSRSRMGSDWQGIRRGGVADYSLFCAEYSID